MASIAPEVFQETRQNLNVLIASLQATPDFNVSLEKEKELQAELEQFVLPLIINNLKSPVPLFNVYYHFDKEADFYHELRLSISEIMGRYSDFISDDRIESYKLIENSSLLNEEVYKTLSSLYKNSENIVSQITKSFFIFSWFYQVDKNICPIIISKKFNFMAGPILELLETMCDGEIIISFDRVLDDLCLNKSEKKKFIDAKKSAYIHCKNIISVIKDYKNRELIQAIEQVELAIEQQQIQKNEPAMDLLKSWQLENIDDQEREKRKKDFKYLAEIVDSNRIPGQGVFSA